jgi:hypothetical protein
VNDPRKAARQAADFKLDFLPTTRHPMATRYSALVFWLIGLGSSSIAKLLLIPRSSVASIVARSEYADRSAMSDLQRQDLLNELRSIRFEDGRPLDAGRLDAISWQIQPLSLAKRRPARKAATP